jgi:hypothetical protein
VLEAFTPVRVGRYTVPNRKAQEDAFPLQFNEELAMQGSTTDRTSTSFVAIHPLDPEDAAITAAMRAMTSSTKGARSGIEARGQFDAFMESLTALAGKRCRRP